MTTANIPPEPPVADPADRRLFTAPSPEAWVEFLAILDRPDAPTPKLDALFRRPSPWTQP